MANAHRGEFPIQLDGTEYTLRADYEAVAAIDSQLGSVMDVCLRLVRDGSLSFREMSVIVCEGIKAHGRATGNVMQQSANPKRCGEMIFASGMATCVRPVADFLMASLNGGVVPEGNAVDTVKAQTG